MTVATELAWAAGLFDGEGWTSNFTGRSVTMGVGQAEDVPGEHPTVLLRFHAAVGLRGTIARMARSKDGTQKPAWRWQATKDARVVLDLLWPYLSGPKRQQAAAALAKADAYEYAPGYTAGKLTAEQVAEIKASIGRGVSGGALARTFGVSDAMISSIRLGKSWKHVEAAA